MARTRPLAVALVALFGASTVFAQAPSDGIVVSKKGMVISSSAPASDVGAQTLAKGGNAVDAEVATAFALAVTYPTAGNIGGGGLMVIRKPDGTSTTIDYREKAPLKATATMYALNRRLGDTGYTSPGVPGTVRGLAMAHKKYGKLPWKDVVMPAANMATNGWEMSDQFANGLNRFVQGATYPATQAAYGKPGGGQWKGGDKLVLRDLGRTLTAIANEGPDVFYKGWIADSLANDMSRHGGLISKEDLAQYDAKERPPVKGSFMGYDLITMGPPTSGGTTMIEILNILENFDLAKYGAATPETYHLIVEAQRRAYLDRARYLGDEDFVKVPIDMLISKSHAKQLAQTIDLHKASSSAELGRDILTVATSHESEQTTHQSVVDADGMAVANTYTLQNGYGSKIVASGTGFILNDEMGDFNRAPGVTDDRGAIGTPPNVIAPGKRMLSSMSPSILTKDGKLFMVTGSPGGRTIINTVMEVVLNATAFHMDVRHAVDAVRLDHEWMPDSVTFERGAVASTLDSLRAMGHGIKGGRGGGPPNGQQGDAHSIIFDAKTGTAYGANDHRSSESKASVP